MPVIKDRPIVWRPLPHYFACVGVDANGLESVTVIRTNPIRMAELLMIDYMDRGFVPGNSWSFDGGREKDFIAPNDWRGMATACYWGLPLYVFGITPFSRQALFS